MEQETKVKQSKKPRGRPRKYDLNSEEYITHRRAYQRNYYHQHQQEKTKIMIRPLSRNNPDLNFNKNTANHLHYVNYLSKHSNRETKFSKYDNVDIKIYQYRSPENPKVIIQTYKEWVDGELVE